MPHRDLLQNVLRRGDVLAIAFIDRLSAAIYTWAESAGRYGLGPGKEIVRLLWQQPSTFLLIQKKNCSGGEALTRRGRSRSRSVLLPERFRVLSSKLRIGTAIRQNCKPEAFRDQASPLPNPGVRLLPGRIGKPVAYKIEVPAQRSKHLIARVVVTIETEERSRL